MEPSLEYILGSLYKEEMISWLHQHPERMDELTALAMSTVKPFAWRAAWLLGSCMEENDLRIAPYLPEIIRIIPLREQGHQRELLKIVSIMQIPEELEGELFDCCITIWEKINNRPGVRYTAFLMLIRISQRYPELYHELSLLLQDYYLETLSPGIRHAMEKKFAELKNKDVD
jgi:hypothetical protein